MVQTSFIDLSLRKVASNSITGYQKYISPHKGFSCAHRLLYGGESCSAYLKRIIREQGLKASWQAAHQRFADCREANLILRSSSTPPDFDKKEETEDKNKSDRAETALDCLGLGCEGCFIESSTDCCSGVDLTPDCGSCGDAW